MVARIFKPAKMAMQSGEARTIADHVRSSKTSLNIGQPVMPAVAAQGAAIEWSEGDG